jgi:hypothetical protein
MARGSVDIHSHARERAIERGASEDEIVATVESGQMFPVKYGRTGFRRNFPFDGIWRGKRYAPSKSKPMRLKRTAAGS